MNKEFLMKQLRYFYSDLLGGRPSHSELCIAREDVIIREKLVKVRLEIAERRAKRTRQRIRRTQEAQLMLPFIR